MITAHGLEGGAIYALSSGLREAIAHDGQTTITLDLRPAMTVDALAQKLAARGSKSLSSFLRSANFSPLAIALLHETMPAGLAGGLDADALAQHMKALKLTLHGTIGMMRAISTAGGVARSAVDDAFMLHAKTGTFVAGEMLDWEAPTGGYLLQACFSTGVAAAHGILRHLDNAPQPHNQLTLDF
jgi:predicted flavoprotein YhiN